MKNLLTINVVLFVVSMLFSASSYASGERMAFMHLSYTQVSYAQAKDVCRFFETGSKVKQHYFEFEGKKTESLNFCEVRFKKTEFYKHFKYCSLSAYNLKYNKWGACSIKEQQNTFVFSAGVPNNDDGIYTHRCEFVCLTKTNGNKTR